MNIVDYFSVTKGRIEYFDIAKAVGLILVVWAHCQGPFTNYIVQFHMPFFFLISGLLYSKHSDTKEFIIRKIKNLYLPFVIWNLIFLIVAGILKSTSILSILKKSILVILMLNKNQLFGPTWFIAALFIIAVVYKLIESSIKDSSIKDIFLLVLFAIIALIGFKFNLPYYYSRIFILSFFYAIGAYLKKYKNIFSSNYTPFIAILGGIIFIIIGSFNEVYMGINVYTYPILFIIGALGASYCLIYLCTLFEKVKTKFLMSIKNIFISIGQHGIDIIIWQFKIFRIIIILQIILLGEKLTVSNIMSHHPVYIVDNGWWIIYLFAGVFLSLLWGYILRQGFWGKILKKIHAV